MKVIDTATIRRAKDARKVVDDLQVRLMRCEILLEDLSRCAEIVQITNQLHLLSSFTEAAQEYLKDKLEMPEQENGPMKIKILTDDKDISSQPS